MYGLKRKIRKSKKIGKFIQRQFFVLVAKKEKKKKSHILTPDIFFVLVCMD
jgi:hypothetical protein